MREDELCGVVPGGDEEGSHVLRFENADMGVTVQIARVYLAPGVGHSTLYGLSHMGLVMDGRTHCSGDPGDIEPLSYESTHHNWRDRASGTVESVRYELYVGMEFTEDDFISWAPTLSGFDTQTGERVLEPIPLVATGGPTECWLCPTAMSVSLSEVMANNEATLPDEEGEFEPWIELYNRSSQAIDLAGYTLSNDLRNRDRWTFPSVTIPPKGYLVVFADGQPEQGELHTNFVLSAKGDAIVLTDPSGTTDGGFAFGAQEPDESLGFSFAAHGYVSLPEPTPGATNPSVD
ncbi:MAG TPA: lamin tail domain-containing protein [Polyangiaceae bacterium]|nr:lamin tail domain-containing protein [Polyangiaceae bacterium]